MEAAESKVELNSQRPGSLSYVCYIGIMIAATLERWPVLSPVDSLESRHR